MKVICVMVASVNGKTTSTQKPLLHNWTSEEDQTYFSQLIQQSSLLIMGRLTYEAAKKDMQHSDGRLRVIITSDPEAFAKEAIPNQLEFTNETPVALITRLEQEGFTKALLLGGAHTNTTFIQENLINELWLTIEPALFGSGNPLFADGTFEKNLKLLSVEKLNSEGTLLLKYACSRDE